jgi:cytochrome P450
LAILAGSDTTSSVLAALLYYLLLNPEVYNRLQEEVDSAFTAGDEPLDAVKLSHMEWLNGCMCVTTHLKNLQEIHFYPSNSNETLRLQPPVPSGSQRSLDKGKGAKVLGNL